MSGSRRFEGRSVVVTGAASGIGAACARRFADEGARLVLGDVDIEGGREVAAATGAVFLPTDVTDAAQVEALVARAVDANGRLDVLFNNAGILEPGTLPELDFAAWQRTIDVDLHPVFHGCRAAIARMREGGGGAIVNTASISGLAGDYALPAYNAAKAAVVNLTRSLGIEHADQGIRVNCVCPGPIETPMTRMVRALPQVEAEYRKQIPMARLGRADEVSGAVLFLASDDASYITGAALVVDGGLTACTGQPNFRRLFESAAG